MVSLTAGCRSLACRAAVALAWVCAASLASAAEGDRPLKPDDPCPTGTTLAQPAGEGNLTKWMPFKGLQYCLTYTGELLSTTSGGVRRGTGIEGRLEAVVHVDLEEALGWKGGTFHANGFQIHGRGPSRYYVGNLLDVSGIEALPSTRLSELWLEQEFAPSLAIRAGELAADTEFLTSTYAGVFVNATFGWPGLTAAALPAGGPVYPFAAPGFRLKAAPSDSVKLLLGVYDGDPAGPGDLDPQRLNRRGVSFRLGDAPFVIGEAQVAYAPDGGAASRPGTLKLGAWRHFAHFSDQRFGADGLLLADPAGSGLPRRRAGDYGAYLVVDQSVWRDASVTGEGPYSGREVGVFGRIAATPSDRNLLDLYADAGISVKGPFAGRPDDVFGVAAAYARVSRSARDYDLDLIAFSGTPGVRRDHEVALEATYQWQVRSGWVVQPDIQYVVHPGGHVQADGRPPGTALRNALVLGLRTVIRY